MIITFFNDKPSCGKSTLTIHTAKALVNLFDRGEDNTRRVFVFDTVTNINNSLIYKKNQENTEATTENERFYVEYLNDYQEFETQKVDFNIQEKDVVFFDLQDFADKQFDFIINSNYVIIVSDNPNELERIDRDMYFLINKLKNYQGQSISLKKIFLTQNRVSPSERIVETFEDIDYINGLEELKDLWKIENTTINKITNPPLSIQKFALEVWKKVNDYPEQIII